MHPIPPGPSLPATLQRLLRLRFRGRPALLEALLDALFSRRDSAELSAPEAARLLALLEGRSDAELELIARRGHPGRSIVVLQLEAIFDGVPTQEEQLAMSRRLLDLLRSGDWPAATLDLRSVVLTDLSVHERPLDSGAHG
jgi:hypothetical protein